MVLRQRTEGGFLHYRENACAKLQEVTTQG
jgi:hypothetical protein